jgi:hypothetical protein
MADIIQFPKGAHQYSVVDTLRICVNHATEDEVITSRTHEQLLTALDSLEAYLEFLNEE